MGAAQYNQCAVQSPDATAGPSDRAGLKLPPVSGPVTNAPANTVAPIANGATAAGVRSSVATPRLTKLRRPVNPISITNACASGTLGNVTPNCPTGPTSHPQSSDASTAP